MLANASVVSTNGERFLTPDELSARYHGRISVRTLANWRYQGTGPRYIRLGGKVLYPLTGVVEWEIGRTYGSTSEYRRTPNSRPCRALTPS